MRDFLLAVAVFATIATTIAIDEECIKRRMRGLALHWPNPADCASFYRCTNKNIKRALICPTGKEYNPKTGRCANKGLGHCWLSLAAPLSETLDDTCVGKISGTIMPDPSSCRSFYLCHNNQSYPQICDAKSYFDDKLIACVPDPTTRCWENLCVNKTNGTYVANDKDCHGFYICDNEKPIAQNCDEQSYFNGLYCQPGKCPSEETTTTAGSTETSTAKPSTTTTSPVETTTTCTPEVTTKACTGKTVTTTTTCAPTTTTKTCVATTTTCKSKTTTTTACTSTTTTTAAATTTTNKPETTTSTTTKATTTRPTATTTSTTNKPESTTTCTPNITTTTTATTTTTSAPTTTNKLEATTSTTTKATTTRPTATTTSTTNKPESTTTCTPNTTTTTTATTTTTCAATTTNKLEATTSTTTKATTTRPTAPTTSTTNKPESTTTCTPNITTTTTATTTTTCAPTTTNKLEATTSTTTKATTTRPIISTTATTTNRPESTTSTTAQITTTTNTTTTKTTTAYKPETTTCTTTKSTTATTTTCKPEHTTTTCTTWPTTTATTTTATTTTCKPAATTTKSCTAETTTACSSKTTTTSCAPQITTTAASNDCPTGKCDGSHCQNATDGFVFAAINTESGFCVCFDQKADYRVCPNETSFDDMLKICTAQDKVCPSSKCNDLPNNSTFCASNTTTGFCRCLSGAATFQECVGTNFVYDNIFGYCVASQLTTSNDEETKKLCEGGHREGDFVANPNNCRLLYICYRGDLVEIDCDEGSYFDDQVKACMPDTYGHCSNGHLAPAFLDSRRPKRSIRAPTCPEGAKTPAADCDKYYKCTRGHKLLYGCGKDNFFNITTLACQLDVQHVCCPVNSCTEGARNPYPEDNTKYYECVKGRQVVMSCGPDSIFSKLTKCCIPRRECTCPGGYKEGKISAHPSDCDKFYICSEGEQLLQTCGKGNYFNKTTLSCKKDVNNICHDEEKECLCPGGYKKGQFSPHPTDCDKYYVCEDGQQVLQECDHGNYFDPDTLKCEPDTHNECWTKEVCTCPGNYEEGQLSAHSSDCNKYYMCHDGKQILEDCGINNYFNNDTMRCERDVYHVCWPNLCAGQTNGTLVANPQQCNTFFLCENDEAIPKACFEGQWFDPKIGACMADLKAVCYNPCAKESAGPVVLLPHPICNEYYFCNGHKTFVGTCLVGSFDNETGVCNENKKCFPNPCDNPNITVYPDLYDPTKFYWCSPQKRPIPYYCPEGTEFNSDLEICKKYSDPDCPDCSQDGAHPTLDGTNDSEFCVCNDGLATKIECAQGYVFNRELRVCYSNAPCDPSFCLDAQEYAIAPNRNNSKSFCMCFNKKPVMFDCPNNGTFNPYTLKCSDYEISPECLQSTCIGVTSNNHIFAPINTKTSNGFCQCIQQIATFKPCGYGSTFNPDLLICQLAEINCNSYQCRGLANNTIIPSVTTTQGYCECINGIATYHNCPNEGEFNVTTSECEAPLCDFSQCTAANREANNYPFPASTPAGFCLCSVGFIPCETEGTLFSSTLGTCIDPCPQASCDGKQDNYLVPSALDTHSFCMCHRLTRTHPTYEKCASESFVFEEKLQLCVPNSEQLCGANACQTVGAFEAKDTLTGFCLCPAVGKKPSFENCAGGVFVPEISACISTAKDVCDVSLCTHATLEHPITLPSNNSITEFCYCSSPGNVMLLPCPDGKYYSQARAMCVSQLQENCKCPSNIPEGAKVPDSASCNKYSICIRGVMHTQTCPSGAYFNAKINDCIPDTTGICAQQSHCTCLGIYYENELLPHPVNPQMYYACQANTLHEYKCQDGHVFNAAQKQCQLNAYPRQKRSADVNNDLEFACSENAKRSVPSNCSQYEICLQHTWQRKTCSNFYYYNPEQQQCIEPQDDFVCSYARVTSLPTCNASMESVLLKAKSCQHYYHCQNEKWHLKSCGRSRYFEAKLSSCLRMPDEAAFKCDTRGNNSQTDFNGKCQHLSQRYYGKNCAMYLICLDNEWWYQYCPPGMYYNRSLNYCIRDIQQQCKDVLKADSQLEIDEFSLEACQQDGLLRPSALACNRYYICLNGKWQMQHCSLGEFYDVANVKCSFDAEGICDQLHKDCLPNERRPVARNCSAYEQCSRAGKWSMKTCPAEEIYDDLLQQCTTNKGICSKYGLKRTCREHESVGVHNNCSLFLYCYQDTWNLGSCLTGFMYSELKNTCMAHMPEDACKPLHAEETPVSSGPQINREPNPCENKTDGTWIYHATDCSRYFVCIQQKAYQEMQCPRGSFFDANAGYCRPNNGSCRLPLTGACTNASDESLIAHPSNCQAYYSCSSFNGTELHYCATSQYFDKHIKQCLIDQGECKKVIQPKQKCAGLQHGARLVHETYCNIYYACVKGLAIPVECPAEHKFDKVLAKCILDKDQLCQYGQLKEEVGSQNCSQLVNGTFLPHLGDCTRYYVCSAGEALPLRCSSSNYFDNEQQLCVPNDGSCPFINTQSEKNHTAPPDPLVCEGRHGYLMADPVNCNNFYVCINNKLKHERCYAQEFFNTTSQQCQPKPPTADLATNNATLQNDTSLTLLKSKMLQCTDEPVSLKQLCFEITPGSSLAEPGDCRRFITCQEPQEEPLAQRCRNGESFDSLLGFCRQNDGTCLMENGQRVGECSGKHGQLARDSNNCRNYFVCINGQKIAQTCEDGKYFSKTQNMCIKDTQNVCNAEQKPEAYVMQSCSGLSESVLYPLVYDNCRSYFQCIKGVAKIHKCADDLYFDPIAIKCTKEKPDCIMPTQTLQRSPAFGETFNKLCSNKKWSYRYAYVANDCQSFYICYENGIISHELCPLGMLFSQEYGTCIISNQSKCTGI